MPFYESLCTLSLAFFIYWVTSIDNAEVIMEKMEQCIIEKNAVIAEKDKRIAELTEKVSAFDIFAERLDKLFTVFEDNANISIVQKVASGLFGKK